MTNEEAILHMILRREELKNSVGDLNEDIKAFDMAIKALELTQTGLLKDCESCRAELPCTDAISRQAAIDAFGLSEKTRKYGGDHSGYNTMMLYEIQDVIEDLPSVSTEKTGRWISWYEVIESADGKSEDHIPHCKCSECNCEYDTYSAHFIKYCQNCGAKMEQPYEGESENNE